MSRIALVVALVVTAALARPADADTTIKSRDGTVELTVPNGWHEGKPFGPAIKIMATSARGSIVFVRVVSKEDFKDLKAVADVALERLKKNMPDAEPKTENVKINNMPAIRISMEGTQANGQRKGFLLTFFETDGRYVDVVTSANASVFKSEEQTLASLASQVKIMAAPDAAAQTTPPPTTASPASGKPPTTRPPR
jgi:hypothetical protein